MEMTGILKAVDISPSGKTVVMFEVNEHPAAMKLPREKQLTLRVTERKPRRSLDANAYFWVLADKLAQRMGVGKEVVYRNAIRDIGGVSEIIGVRDEAVEHLRQGWESKGLGWQTETMPSAKEGFTNVVLYYGSSTYDRAQMAQLIDNIVQDCKAVGIETMTPDEIARLEWTEHSS